MSFSSPRIVKAGKERISSKSFCIKLSQSELDIAQTLERTFANSLKYHSGERFYYEHGYRSGELHESNLWQIASGLDNARPFSVRETIDLPDFHIGLLVDCSGSMAAPVRSGESYSSRGGYNSSGSLMSVARSLALGLAKAFDAVEGVHFSVCGHTEQDGNVELLMIKRPKTKLDIDAFGALAARAGNLDGLACVAFAGEMAKDMKPGEPGMLILISDGAPCHTPTLMKKSFLKCKQEYNISVFPIGIGQELSQHPEVCESYYGYGKYVLAADVVSAAPRIASYANSLMSELKPM